MAWTTPMTAVANTAFTAAEFNTHVRDNLNETMPALATSTSNATWFVADGANSIVARNIISDIINSEETTSATSYTDLATTGPSVTVTTGTSALAFYSVRYNNSEGSFSIASVEVSGSTSISANDEWGIGHSGVDNDNNWIHGRTHMFTGLTPGSNTFTMKYYAFSGTGEWSNRHLAVWAF